MSDALNVSSEVAALAERLKDHHWRLATAESCTGGLIAASCTALSGSSDWFERGFVTYSNASKTESIGVSPSIIEQYGAVSEEVAKAMAQGALNHSAAKTSIAITGIAGPGGSTENKPVGMVCFAWAVQFPGSPALLIASTQIFDGDRQAIREQACAYALNELIQILRK